jgi:hypothetical protein
MRGAALLTIASGVFAAVPAAAQSSEPSQRPVTKTSICSFRSATTCWNVWRARARPSSTLPRRPEDPRKVWLAQKREESRGDH